MGIRPREKSTSQWLSIWLICFIYDVQKSIYQHAEISRDAILPDQACLKFVKPDFQFFLKFVNPDVLLCHSSSTQTYSFLGSGLKGAMTYAFRLDKFPGVYKVERLLILFPPPCFWFSSPRRVALHYKINDILPPKQKKQYVIGLNSVKMCCSNQILPFGTTKSVKSSKIFFFLLF